MVSGKRSAVSRQPHRGSGVGSGEWNEPLRFSVFSVPPWPAWRSHSPVLAATAGRQVQAGRAVVNYAVSNHGDTEATESHR